MKQIALFLGFLGTFAASACGEEQIRFRLDMDAFGNAKITVKKAKGPLATAGGNGVERYGSARLPKTRIDRTKGLVRLVHDFADPDPLKALSPKPPPEVEIDKRFDVLTFKSEPGKPVGFSYGYRVAFPVAIAFDEFQMPELSATRVRLDSAEEALIVSVYRGDKSDPKFYIASSWIDRNKNQRTQIVEAIPFDLDAGIEHKFRLPLPNAEIKAPFFVSFIGDSQRKSVQEISSLMIQGKIKPLLGIGFDKRAGLIYAKSVFDGSIAADAGVEAGDVVTEISGKRPTSVEHAVELVGETKFGEVVTLEILRAKKPATISIKFE